MATLNPPEGSNGQASDGIISIMPVFDDLLNLIGQQATSNDIAGDSNADIVKKAKELHAQIEEMTSTALGLPGGHVSLEQAKELEMMLDEEAAKRRSLLKAFVDSKMEVVDKMEVGGDNETELVTPAAPGRDHAMA